MINAIRFMFACNAMLLVFCIGCNQEELSETVNAAEESVETTAKNVASEAAAMASKGEEMARELGAEAMAFLNPMKEKLGNLESLKEKPEELKTMVSELINSIEQKAEKMTLPESMSQAFASLKEKLISLRDYLEGEYEQAKIGEHLKGIMDSVKSEFGM